MIVEENKKITVTIDGVEHEAQPGQMLIELTDKTVIFSARFCYHEKLSIAAIAECVLLKLRIQKMLFRMCHSSL